MGYQVLHTSEVHQLLWPNLCTYITAENEMTASTQVASSKLSYLSYMIVPFRCKLLTNKLHTTDKLKISCNSDFPFRSLPFTLIAELRAVIFTAPNTILMFIRITILFMRQTRLKYFLRCFCLRSFKISPSVKWEQKFLLSHLCLRLSQATTQPPENSHTLGMCHQQREMLILSMGGCTCTHPQIIPTVLTQGRKHCSQTLGPPM